MTQLPPPTPEESAFERGFKNGAEFAAAQRRRVPDADDWWHRPDVELTQPGTTEAATQAARTIIGGQLTMRDIRLTLLGAFGGMGLFALLAFGTGAVKGHDVTSASADCAAGTITVKGQDFDVATNTPVTVTGPNAYSQTFPVTSSSWTQVLPLGSNGTYTADWPHSDGHAFTFQVACTAPTAPPTPTPTRGAVPPEPTPVVTPSPSPTPSPTPTASVAAATSTPKPTPEPTETPIPSIPLPQTDTE